MSTDEKTNLNAEGKPLPLSRCPVCAHAMDQATCVAGGHRPKPGDFSICIQCGAILRYGPDYALCAASTDDASTDDLRFHLRLVQYAVRRLRKTP